MRQFWLTAGLLLVLLGLTACGAISFGSKKPVYAIIMKSKNNQYNELVAESFRQVIEEKGFRCEIQYPETSKSLEQEISVQRWIREGVKAIAVSAADEHALSPVLKEAMGRKITVTTLDSDTEQSSRSIFVSPADWRSVGTALMQSVRECMEGNGQWAILSSETRSANQKQWIHAMQTELEQPEYRNMRLVDIVYGQDDYETSVEKARELIEKYPGLRVICAPSAVGIKAAADVIKESGLENRLKVIGLGLPSEMAEYIGTGEADVCPVMYLWDPANLGKLSAYVTMGIAEGTIIPEAGAEFETPDGQSYRIEENEEGGLEVKAGEPLRLDESTIGVWKDRM